MAQKPVLQAEVHSCALRVDQIRKEDSIPYLLVPTNYFNGSGYENFFSEAHSAGKFYCSIRRAKMD